LDATSSPEVSPEPLARLYAQVRAATVRLAAPLAPEDQMVQSMSACSPTKWHLAHTTWFFDTFVLRPHAPGHRSPLPEADRLFNSYYESVAPPPDRTLRGTLSRPTLAEVHTYRQRIDEAMARLLATGVPPAVAALIELGVNHEEQHQELILTDIKHAFGVHPLLPSYRSPPPSPSSSPSPSPSPSWFSHPGGIAAIGRAPDTPGFSFDNETPRHRVVLQPFQLAGRLVTCGEYLAFMQDGGYRRPELWLSDGWQVLRGQGWRAPLYWEMEPDGGYRHLTLRGPRAVAPDEPVVHVSYYEADAYARWAGARLPREAEWEAAAADAPLAGNLLESDLLHPAPATASAAAPASTTSAAPASATSSGGGGGPLQLYGDAWEWTASPYVEYPGYRRPPGALGEYNGKFMCNQLVLRGGSCVTPRRHLRPSYRNFFAPDARWQFSGIRLCRDV
jgi:ergothioneine biosynthesis protein EgtB